MRADVPLLALAGTGLCLTSVLMMLMRRLEGDYGLPLLNLAFAFPIAVVAVGALALLGDSMLTSIADRSGRRPGRCATAWGLAIIACAGAATATLTPDGHRCGLSRLIGLLGSLALLIASASAAALGPMPGHVPR